jgi:hypothetical protein
LLRAGGSSPVRLPFRQPGAGKNGRPASLPAEWARAE